MKRSQSRLHVWISAPVLWSSGRLGEPKNPSALTCHPVFLMHGYIKPRCFHNADKDLILDFPHAHLRFCWGILWRYFCIVCPQSGSILHICRRTHMVVYRICWWEPQTPCPRRHTLPWERIVSSSIPTLCLHKTSRKSNVTAVKRCSCAHRWTRTNLRHEWQHDVDRWTMWTGGHRPIDSLGAERLPANWQRSLARHVHKSEAHLPE